MRFVVSEWKNPLKSYSMLILTEEDVENKSGKYIGAGYEILILPSKYKNINSDYLDRVRMLPEFRGGQIIYV